MKSSWKKLITSLAIAAILAGQTGTASAGVFSSVVRKAAGVAASQAGSGSTFRRAAGAVLNQAGNGSITGRVINKAAQVVTGNENSLAGKVLNKVVTDPNSLTSRVVRRLDNIDSNSLTGKILDKAKNSAANPNSLTGKILNRAKTSVNDPNSLTGKILSKAKVAAADPNSLTSRILNKAKTAANDPNSLTGKILARAKTAGNDPNSLTSRILNKAKVAVDDPTGGAGRIIDKAKVAVKDPTGAADRLVDKLKGPNGVANIQGIVAGDNLIKDKLLKDRIAAQIKKAIEANGGVNIAEVAAQAAADAINGNGAVDAAGGVVVDAANQNGQNDQLVNQLLNAGIQAGGQILSSAIEARANGGFVQGGGGGFVEAAPEPVFVSEPVATIQEAAPVAAAIDLELYDLRRVEAGNDEQGPLYRVMVKNLSNANVTSEITVALLASVEKDSDDNVSVLGSLESLGAGATKSVELRLPKGSEALSFLTAVAALTDSADANETDNIATYDRDAVLAAR